MRLSLYHFLQPPLDVPLLGAKHHNIKQEAIDTHTWVPDFALRPQDILAIFFGGSGALVPCVSSTVSIISSDMTFFLEPPTPKTDLEKCMLYYVHE